MFKLHFAETQGSMEVSLVYKNKKVCNELRKNDS